MAGTTINYNGVLFDNIQTSDVSQEAVYDQSKTDLLYYHVRVVVVGIVHAQLLAKQLISAGIAATAATAHTRLQELVMQPRKGFEMRIGGETLLTAGPPNSGLTLDVTNGPHPQSFRILSIVGNKVITVQWTIEFDIVLCESGKVSAGTVLNNRWHTEDDYDGNFFVTRIVSGRLRIAGDGAQTNPHMLRGLVIPPLERNFKWEAGRFNETTDGLELEYSVTHRQVANACPSPATTWEGTHSESTNDGYTPISRFRIRVEGPPDVSKAELLVLAVKLSDAKVKWSLVRNDALLEELELIDNLAENSVELNIVLRRTNDLASIAGVLFDELGKPVKLPGYDRSISVAFPADGKFPHLANLFIAYLQDPCNANHAYPTAGSSQSTSPSKKGKGDKGPKIEATTSPSLDPDSPSYSPEHFTAIYTHYAVGGCYEVDQHKTQCPVATVPSEGGTKNPTCAIVPLALPTARRVVTMEAERVGDWPRVPMPTDYQDEAGGRATLVDHQITPVPPRLGPDGRQRVYSVNAVLTYALERAPTPEDQLRAGAFPYDKLALSATMFPTTAYTNPNDSTKAIS